jgi:hypothetical protein
LRTAAERVIVYPDETAMLNVDWLTAWMEQQIGNGHSRAVALPGVQNPAMYLHGSIGYDTAITTDGDVWIGEYQLDGPDAFQEHWRPAGTTERLGYLVIAAKKHSELRRLLPERPTAAPPCEGCNGSGERHFRATDGTKVEPIPGLICEECGGLGWVAG